MSGAVTSLWGWLRATEASALALLFVANGACSQLASGSDTLLQSAPELRPDASTGEAVDPRWACLDKPDVLGAVALRPFVELSLTVTDIGSDAPPAGLSARACNRLDVGCLTPVVENVGVGLDGALHLSLMQGFEGFVELTSPTSFPTMFFVNQQLMTDTRETFAIVNPMSLQALAASGGVTLDTQVGHLLVRTFDCEGVQASGVQISNRSGGQVFSFADGLPVLGLDVTTGDGLGGFVNVRPGLVFLQGIEVDRARISGTTSVVVRAGWLTYGDLEPPKGDAM